MKSASTTHELPPLPYAAASLVPYIDARTLRLHHDVHHAAYVKALNLALETTPALHDKSPEWLLHNLDRIPESIRTAVRNNAGGHINHSLFWRAMAHPSGGAPSVDFALALTRSFGSVERFKRRFEEAGSALFGSGWVWLVANPQNDCALEIMTTSGHDTPILHGKDPVLVNDVWEHAYYLQYQNQRAEYLERWWMVVNWPEAESRLESARKSAGVFLERRREPRLEPAA